MWEHYRKYFLLTQCFIFAICGGLLLFGVDLRALLVPFSVMQIGAVFGARWAVRLKGSSSDGLLPPLR